MSNAKPPAVLAPRGLGKKQSKDEKHPSFLVELDIGGMNVQFQCWRERQVDPQSCWPDSLAYLVISRSLTEISWENKVDSLEGRTLAVDEHTCTRPTH